MHWIIFIEIYITNVVDGRIEQLESSRERRWACILGIALFSLELDSILNLDILVIKSRDWTLDEQQVFGRIHLYNLFTIVNIHFISLSPGFIYSPWDFEQWHCFHPYDQPSFYPWTPCLATKTNYPYQPNDLLHAYNRWYTLRWPVEPAERWDNEWPWDAGWPAKFHRFMTPAKPLPILDTRMMNITWPFFLFLFPIHKSTYEGAVTSTYWPVTKWDARSSVPKGSMASSVTRNSASFWRKPTPNFLKCSIKGLETFFSFLMVLPIWRAEYPFFSTVRTSVTITSSN